MPKLVLHGKDMVSNDTKTAQFIYLTSECGKKNMIGSTGWRNRKRSNELNFWTSTLLGKTLVSTSHEEHNPQSESWWLQHQVLGRLLCGKDQKTHKVRSKNGWSPVQQNPRGQSTEALKFGRRFIFQQGNDLKHTATELEQYCFERMSKNSIIKMCNTDLKATEDDNHNPARGDPTRFNLWEREYLYIQMQLQLNKPSKMQFIYSCNSNNKH